MIARKVKPGRCAHCKVRMEEANRRIHDECIAPWLEVQTAKKERARQKREREQDRAKRQDLKTIADLIADAQKAFNAFIRARDEGKPCICCGRPFELAKPGGSVDAGHYRSRGAAPHLRFNEANCHAQRKNCNRPGGTTIASFRAGMIERVGLKTVEALEADNNIRKWERAELIAIKAMYVRRLKDLKKERS